MIECELDDDQRDAIGEMENSGGMKALRLKRHGYEAFIRRLGKKSMFDGLHKHYHEDDWRSFSASRRTLVKNINRVAEWEVVEAAESPFIDEDLDVELDNLDGWST